MGVLNDLKARGVYDILVAVLDGLQGVPQAVESAFPRTTVQSCIVHLIRHSLRHALRKARKPLACPSGQGVRNWARPHRDGP